MHGPQTLLQRNQYHRPYAGICTELQESPIARLSPHHNVSYRSFMEQERVKRILTQRHQYNVEN